ncbi:MAG: secretion system protein [Verrucomicrobia bacterium]|nr:MAG: secretion system protein [Verrucomicrobiota bacterium]
MTLLIPLLYALCFAGLAYTIGRAVREGMDGYASTYATETAREFEDIFLFIPAKRLADIARLSALALFLVIFFTLGEFGSYSGLLRGCFFGGIAAVGALLSPRGILYVVKQRRLQRFNLQLLDSLLSMSNALRAGFSILQAFETVVRERRNPISMEYSLFLQQIRLGVRFEDAMRQMEQRVGSEDLTLMVLSIETARQTGGNLTEVFEKIASTIRERMRIQGRIRSLTAQGRLQGIIVGAMPFILMVVLTLLDPVMMSAFFHSQVGMVLIGTVVIFVTLGGLVIRKIIRIEV